MFPKFSSDPFKVPEKPLEALEAEKQGTKEDLLKSGDCTPQPQD